MFLRRSRTKAIHDGKNQVQSCHLQLHPVGMQLQPERRQIVPTPRIFDTPNSGASSIAPRRTVEWGFFPGNYNTLELQDDLGQENVTNSWSAGFYLSSMGHGHGPKHDTSIPQSLIIPHPLVIQLEHQGSICLCKIHASRLI